MRRRTVLGTGVVGALLLGGALLASEGAPKTATANLVGAEGSGVRGKVTFTEMGDHVMIVAEVEGASSGLHGFPVHEKGDCSAADFTSAGGHFNPTGFDHGATGKDPHHAGDFGNLTVGDDGHGRLELHAMGLTVGEGPGSVVGRAVILHEKADDLTSQPTGAAGARIACGVVEEMPAE